MKKLILIMAIIFSLSFFTGCGQSTLNLNGRDFIMFCLDISSNGRIIQSLDFSVNSDRLDNISESQEEKLSFIATLTEMVDELRREFLLNFALIYIQNPNEEYKINQGLIITNTTFNQETDTIGFNMIFTSLGAWNYYHDVKQNENDDKKEDDNIFISKNQTQGIFPFSSKIKVSEEESIYVGQRYIQKYIDCGKNFSFANEIKNLYSPLLIYNYSTYYSRLHSDADYKFTDSNGHSHHIWAVDGKDLTANNSIYIYSYNINVGLWYLFILIFSIVFAVILYIILDYKNIKNKIKNIRFIKKHSK